VNRPNLSLPALSLPSGTTVTSAVRRPAVVAVLAVLLLALVSGGVWAATGKTATLAVDGDPREVSFRGSTVADVLDAAGVSVGQHDSVVPAPSTRVDDGARVALRRGRQLQVVVDGQERTVWVTAASVGEALDQIGLRGEGLALSASRSRTIPLEGMRLDVLTPKGITINADGATQQLQSTALTVADALAEAAITVDADDRLSVPAETPVSEGLVITVARVVVERVDEEVPVSFGTERREDGELLVGQTKQVVAGVAGVERRTVERVVVDGVLESANVVATAAVRAPVDRVIAVGTKPKPKPAPAPKPAAAPAAPADSGSRSSTGAEGLNWAALARCESGGNPSAVSSTGKYRGLYQFSMQTWAGVGGSGDPAAASSGEQTYRAQLLYKRSGAGQWPTCGKNLFT
jgi:uncharacterized protein YabE (DUF348 family)